jgi:hypothetical protein
MQSLLKALLGNGWPLNNAKAVFPMGSGPRLYTESHVAAEWISSYYYIENGDIEISRMETDIENGVYRVGG